MHEHVHKGGVQKTTLSLSEKWSPIGSGTGTLGPQMVTMSGDMEPVGSGALVQEAHCYRLVLRVYSLPYFG